MTNDNQIKDKRIENFLKRLANILYNFFLKEENIKKQSKQLLEQAIDKAEEKKMAEIKKHIDNLKF